MKSINIKIKKLDHFKGKLPEYKSEYASGFDVRACLSQPLVLKSGHRALIPTGLCFEIPSGFELQARPRSGLALHQGLSVLNTPGTIDSDYRGEVKIILINSGQETVTVEDQERVAQIVLCPVYQAKFEECKTLTESKRSQAGFGSTGRL